MDKLDNVNAGEIIGAIAKVIVENKAYLSEIDGKIGDGDHGINMAKGFGRAAERFEGKETSLDAAMEILSDVLMNEIGGSMGPLYGMMFSEMAESIEGVDEIDAQTFGQMLRAGLAGIQEIGGAKVGDKTLLDTLVPALDAYDAAVAKNLTWHDALSSMKLAAETGRDSTVDMVALIGRSARLGERSRGVLDAGATSCCLILCGFADGISSRL